MSALTRAGVTATDDWLVQRARGGDRPAFAELYARHARTTYNLVFRLLESEPDSEDATQEVFYQAFRNLSRFQGRSTFLTWLYRIATNVALGFRRACARRRRHTVSAIDGEREPRDLAVSSGPDPEAEVERHELHASLLAAVNRLPASQRAVIVLGPIQGRTYDEISAILGLPLNAIKGRLHRARVTLRALAPRWPRFDDEHQEVSR